jgi:hypothetical protein
VLARFFQARDLVRLANSILLGIFSVFSGQPISSNFEYSLKLFFDHAVSNSHINFSFQARVHTFVISCAKRLFDRGVRRSSLISGADVEHFISEDVMKELKVSGSNISPSLSVPVVCDLVSLPSSLSAIRMLDFLPGDLAHYYSSPSLCLRSDPPSKLPRPFMGASQSEYVKLVRRLYSLGMISFQQSVRVVNGLFAVAKDVDSQRLILDCRPANALFNDVLPTILPNPSDLSNLLLPANVPVFATKCDLDNYYHRIVVPEWMVPYLGLPKVRAGDLDPSIYEQYGADTLVFPAFLRFPMVAKFSVNVSSAMHTHFLSNSVLRPFRFLQPGQRYVLQIGEVVIIVYIDYLCLIGCDRDLLDHLMATLMREYASAGFIVKLSKYVPATTDIVELLCCSVWNLTESNIPSLCRQNVFGRCALTVSPWSIRAAHRQNSWKFFLVISYGLVWYAAQF